MSKPSSQGALAGSVEPSHSVSQAGASVLANYVRDEKSAKELKEQADAAGYRIELCRADVTSAKGIADLSAALDSHAPNLSIFVHCAATGVHRPLDQFTLRHFDWTYALNVRAFFDWSSACCRDCSAVPAFWPSRRKAHERRCLKYALVGSSKGALESMVRHFAVELAPRGIRVNSLSAGAVLTDAWKVMPDGDRRLAEAIDRSPVGRLNTVDEVAWAAQFLLSRRKWCRSGERYAVADGGLGIVGGQPD